MNQGVFWGILIIIFGILLIVKQLFNLEFPVFRVMIGLFLVFLGIKILFFHGNFSGTQNDSNVLFGTKEMNFDPSFSKYDCVFGSLKIDMSDLSYQSEKVYDLNAVFGEIVVKINPNTLINLKSEVVMGNIELPQEARAFGKEITDSNLSILNIKASAVFGNIKFVVK